MRVACAVITAGDKILVTQRGPTMKLPFMWEFPGGKIEAGESDEACIIRELKEELNVSVQITGKLKEFIYENGSESITLVPFLALLTSDSITLAEHMNYAWLSHFELKTLDWAPADIKVMEEVMSMFR